MLDIFLIGVKTGISVVKKSPINFWLSALVNTFYYIANGFFWYVLIDSKELPPLFDIKYIHIFFATICVVDNFYLLFFGKGSFLLVDKVRRLKLDPHLILPVNIQALYILTNISFEHAILSIFSLTYFIFVHVYFHIPLSTSLIHLIMTLEGVIILAAITWIIRTTVFWTSSLISIKNSNPCFKVLVRPEQSFSGAIRFFLLFILPCLFITGIPSSVANNTMKPYWLIIQTLVCIGLIILSKNLFNFGVKRYSKFPT